jgi:splicing factor 45
MAQPPPRGGGLSLYANLLDPKEPPPSSATISSAPVVYSQSKQLGSEPTSKPLADPSLRFQPIRRPQAKQANKPKQSFPKVSSKPVGEPAAIEPQAAAGAAAPKSRLADWAATEDDEWLYGTGEKRQRGGRKKKKRKQEYQAQTDWEELYDPSKPTNIDEYVRSDEKIDEVRDWKALLYRHRRKPVDSDSSDAEDTGSMPQSTFPNS